MRKHIVEIIVVYGWCIVAGSLSWGEEVYRQEQVEDVSATGDVFVRVRSTVEDLADTLKEVAFTVDPRAEVLAVYMEHGASVSFRKQREDGTEVYVFDLPERVLPGGQFTHIAEVLNRRGAYRRYATWHYEGMHRPGPVTVLSKRIVLPVDAEVVDAAPEPVKVWREDRKPIVQFERRLERGAHFSWDVQYRLAQDVGSGEDLSEPEDEQVVEESEAYAQLGVQYKNEARWEEAAEYFEQALAINPKHIEAAFYLGRIAYAQGRLDQGIRCLEKVLMLQQNTGLEAWTRITLAWMYDELGYRASAIDQYEAALALHPAPSVVEAARLGLDHPHVREKRVPFATDGIARLPVKHWKGASNFQEWEVTYAFDRDPNTRWHTVHAQRERMFYRLDLGQIYTVQGIYLDDDGGGVSMYRADYPRAYRIEVSLDGRNWETVAYREGDMEQYAGARFAPVGARFIQITQTGSDPVDWWSIHEIYVYRPGPPPLRVKEGEIVQDKGP